MPNSAAKIQTYKEAMTEVISRLQGIPQASGALGLLQAVLAADDRDHIAQRDKLQSLMIRMLDLRAHVIRSVCAPGCPLCGGMDDIHASECLVEVALYATPPDLEMLEPSALVSLVSLRNDVSRLKKMVIGGKPIDPRITHFLDRAITNAPIPFVQNTPTPAKVP